MVPTASDWRCPCTSYFTLDDCIDCSYLTEAVSDRSPFFRHWRRVWRHWNESWDHLKHRCVLQFEYLLTSTLTTTDTALLIKTRTLPITNDLHQTSYTRISHLWTGYSPAPEVLQHLLHTACVPNCTTHSASPSKQTIFLLLGEPEDSKILRAKRDRESSQNASGMAPSR